MYVPNPISNDNWESQVGLIRRVFHWSLQIATSQGVTEWVPDEFHERLSVHTCDNIEEVERFYAENYHVLTGNYGVLKFMYTVLLTKVSDCIGLPTMQTFKWCSRYFFPLEMQKVQNIIGELLDSSEPLIHDTYGCGSQGLINLMLTGQAVPHVWDFDKDVGGLSKFCLINRGGRDFTDACVHQITELRGISQQSDIGFLTLMEQLRYCTVGSFYKNPKNPVWVMASETHLTGKPMLLQNVFHNCSHSNLRLCIQSCALFSVILVLFSYEKNLVSKETPSEIARRVFKSYDPEGNNFIPNPLLQDVLSALELVSEPE